MLAFAHMDWIASSAVITGTHMVIALVIVLLVFGPKRLPELSRALGRSIRDFKKGMNEIKDELENADRPEQPPLAAAPPAAPAVAPVVTAAPPVAPAAAPAASPAAPQPPAVDMFPSDSDPHKK